MARVSEGCVTWHCLAACVKFQVLADGKEVSDLMDFHARQIRYFEFSLATGDHASLVPDWIRDRHRSTINAAGPS